MHTTQIKADSSKWLKGFAKFGLFSKGVVYSLSGILALMATLEIGKNSGKDADKEGVFKFIYEQPFGQILLAIIAVGLLCYAAWRLLQGFKDTENKGSNMKGLGRRSIYIFSGLLYLSISFYAAKLVVTGSKEKGDNKKELTRDLLNKPFGQILVGLVAGIMVASGVSQFYRALSGKYKKHVEKARYENPNAAGLLIKAGKIGYIARGIVWFIIGWLFLKVAYSASAEKAGSGNVFEWLQSWTYGSLLMGIVAAGLICYGIFMFVRARYQHIHI